ncbi:MAG: DUF1631 family protein [Burkholderiaceae bacterium]
MSHRPTFNEYVQYELRQAGPLFESIADAVLESWRNHLPTRLASDLDAPRVLLLHRADFIGHAVTALREQVLKAQSGPTPVARKTTGRLELSLVEDDEVTTDIEIARVVERANSELEHEVRELRTFTSGLVGDVNTSRETNPLRPEAWVRALMAGARAVPISRNMQTSLLRAAAPPLIRAIRDTYTAACARLEALGVVAASHRTIVNEGEKIELTEAMRARRGLDRPLDPQYDDAGQLPGAGGEFGAPGGAGYGGAVRGGYGYAAGAAGHYGPARPGAPASVHALLRQVERGLSQSNRFFAPLTGADNATTIPGEAPRTLSGQPAVERLSQIFDAIMADRRLPRDCLPLLSRYYPGALRFALSEPQAIDDADHPIWRFVDHLSFLVQTRAVGDVQANLAFARSLVDQLASSPASEAKHFQSAISRISVHERQRFARAVAAAAESIQELNEFTHHRASGFGPSVPDELDAGGVDPDANRQLRRVGDTLPVADSAPDVWKPGVWLTLFLRGQWRRALVLWRGPAPGPWLMLDAAEARYWAVRRQSLERLVGAGLAREFGPRSLMRDALPRIGKVLREPGSTFFG